MEDTLTLSKAMNAQKNETIKNAFQKEKKGLLQFIRSRVSRKDDAEDILQDVFYQLTQNFDPLEPIEKVSSWLFRVAKNKIIDRHRKHKPEFIEKYASQANSEEGKGLNLLDVLFDPLDNPEDVYVRTMIWEALSEALEELPAAQREVFVMHELEGMDFKEIAALTGDPVNTLISRKRYAVLFLRERLKKFYDEMSNI